MTDLTDTLARSLAMLRDGWGVADLNRINRRAREAQERQMASSKSDPNQIAAERAKAEKAAAYRQECDFARQMRGYAVNADVLRGTALHETSDQIDAWRVWWDRCKQIGEVA